MREVTDADREIGRRIRETRLDRRMSIKNLGLAASVTFQQMQKYEAGVNRIAASRLAVVARTLNVSVSELLGNEEPPPPSPVGFSPNACRLAAAYDRLPDSPAKRHLHDLVLGLAEGAAQTRPPRANGSAP